MSLILSGTDGLSDVDGTAATPAIRGTDANTGIFFGTDIIGFSEGGVEAARINADSQFVAAAGTAALPVITTTGDLNTGIFFPAADTIAFSEGGAECARFNSSGYFGIGTTSPSQLLHVNSAGAAIGIFQSTLAAGNTNVETRYISTNRTWGVGQNIIQTSSIFEIADVTASATRLAIDSSGNVGIGTTSGTTFSGTALIIHNATRPNLRLTNSTTGQASTDGGEISQLGSDLIIENREAANIITYNNGAERMRIDSSGNVLVGTTSAVASTRFAVERIGGSGNEANIGFTSSGTAKWKIGNVATDAFVIYTPSNVGQYMNSGGTTWIAATSDERLKNKVSDIAGALDAVSKLNPLTYYFKNEEQTGVPRYGFFAQNVGQAIPDAMLVSPTVDEELGEIYTYDSSIINVYLVKAIQEQQALITSLTARITALESN